ncbi:MAG: hypothetical protein II031_03660 [Bacteroidales bacterium]|nr:hypothetical protein [Bacteroidales bacterium]
MNSEKLYKIAGEIDDRFVSETMRPKASPRVRRWLGAAAAVLLVAGAVFGISRIVGIGESPKPVGPDTQTTAEPGEPTIIETYTATPADEYNAKLITPEGVITQSYCLLSDGTWMTLDNPRTEGIKYPCRVKLIGMPDNAAEGTQPWSCTQPWSLVILCMEDKYTFEDIFRVTDSSQLPSSQLPSSAGADWVIVEMSCNAELSPDPLMEHPEDCVVLTWNGQRITPCCEYCCDTEVHMDGNGKWIVAKGDGFAFSEGAAEASARFPIVGPDFGLELGENCKVLDLELFDMEGRGILDESKLEGKDVEGLIRSCEGDRIVILTVKHTGRYFEAVNTYEDATYGYGFIVKEYALTPGFAYNADDAARLRAFLEIPDENGVRNGEKLFPFYEAEDPSTWALDVGSDNYFVWNRDGRLTEICLGDGENGQIELAGTMALVGFDSLERVLVGQEVVLESMQIANCPALRFVMTQRPVKDAAILDLDMPRDGFCIMAGETISANFTGSVPTDMVGGDPLDGRSYLLTADGGGYLKLNGGMNDEDGEYEICICAFPDEGGVFAGWYDELSNLYSADSVVDVTFEAPPEGEGFVLQAEFSGADAGISFYTGDLPTSSAEMTEIMPDETVRLDLDLDGKPDTITFTDNGPNEGIGEGNNYVITVELGAKPGKVFTLKNEDYIISCALHVMDCDTSDGRLDMIFESCGADDSRSVIGFRVNGTGGMDAFPIRRAAFIKTEGEGSGTFDPSQGIPVAVDTDVFDTQFVTARMILTADGFRLITPFAYPDPETPGCRGFRELKRDMKAYRMFSGREDEEIVLPAGTEFAPVETDLETYVKLLLKDGSTVCVKLEMRGWDVLIDGVSQDEYCEVWYAG